MPVLKLSAPGLLQSGTQNYTTLTTLRSNRAPGFTVNADECTVYNYAGDGDYDFLITADGAPEYTSRATGEVHLKLRLRGHRNYAGFLILANLGRNCSFSTSGEPPPGIWEYSYGTRNFDGELENDDYPYPVGQDSRLGCLVQFIFIDGVCYPIVTGYAQQIDNTGYDYEVIPGYSAEAVSAGSGSIAMPTGSYVAAGAAPDDETYVEFVFNTTTKDLEVWGINPAGERVGQIYPALASGGDVTAIDAVLDEFVTAGTPVAGHVRTRGVNSASGFEVLFPELEEPDCVPAITGAFGGEGAYAQATFPSLHRYPGSLPPFLAGGHSFQHVGVAEDFAFEQGEDRSRQIYTFNPQIVDVSTELNQSEFDVFWNWYEGDLRAGAVRFDVQVAEQGGTGLAWWAAQFVEAYTWNYLSGNSYEVNAQLLLLDGPYALRTAPSLRGATALRFNLRALPSSSGELLGAAILTTSLQARLDLPPFRAGMTLTTTLRAFFGDLSSRLTEHGQSRSSEVDVSRTLE